MKPDWMTDDDIRILELLDDTDAAMTPKGIAFTIPEIRYYTIGNRLPKLFERGFIETPDVDQDGLKRDGVYRISDLGRQFLSGDITLRELREKSG